MNIEKIIRELFEDAIDEYENEKMIENGGVVKRTTSSEFLGGLKNV